MIPHALIHLISRCSRENSGTGPQAYQVERPRPTHRGVDRTLRYDRDNEPLSISRDLPECSAYQLHEIINWLNVSMMWNNFCAFQNIG